MSKPLTIIGIILIILGVIGVFYVIEFVVAVIIGIVITFLGSFISLEFNLPPGATIVISLAFLFIISMIINSSAQKTILSS